MQEGEVKWVKMHEFKLIREQWNLHELFPNPAVYWKSVKKNKKQNKERNAANVEKKSNDRKTEKERETRESNFEWVQF